MKKRQNGTDGKDLPQVKKLLKASGHFSLLQRKKYSLLSKEANQYRSETMKKLVEEKLVSMNEKLKAPQDAMAKLEQGKIVISKSVDGKQYDVTSLLKDYDKQKHKSEIHLKSAYIQPIKENDPIIKKKRKHYKIFLRSLLIIKCKMKCIH